MDHEHDARGSTTDTDTFARTRTARWVEAQASESYTGVSPDIPSPSPCSTLPSSSNRTTTSSDQSFARPPPNSTGRPMSSAPMTSVPPTHRRVYSHSHARPIAPLPFPQSPPGSGYPMALQVAPPRAIGDVDGPYSTKGPRRPSVRKRRGSLLEQIKTLTAPTIQRKRDGEQRK